MSNKPYLRPYLRLKKQGVPLIEVPLTLNGLQANRCIYVARVAKGFRVGEILGEYEVSFVIPTGVVLNTILRWIRSQS